MKRDRSFSFILLCAFLGGVTGIQGQDYQLYEFEKHQLSDQFFGEGATFGDINGDGENDIISGPYWYAGPDFEERHAYYPPKPFDINGYSDNFFAFTHDLNRDGRLDILIVGFPGKQARWYENPGPDGWDEHWEKHIALDVVDNESPTFKDITGDGRPDLICQSGGYFGYATVNWEDPKSKWHYHQISKEVAGGRFTHGLGIGDVNGDGRMDMLEKSGWWEQPESLEGDPLWTRHEHQFSKPGGAQMYAYDVDGDGDNDVITSIGAHAYGLAWYENSQAQTGEIDFKQHKIIGKDPEANRFGVAFSQLHAVDLVDMNDDGLKDIVTGKRYWAHNGHDPGAEEPAVLYWFRLDRNEDGAEFVPRPIDNDSGVGTQVVAGDVDENGYGDVVVGNKKGTFVFLNERKKVSQFEYFWAHQPGMFTVGLTPEQAVEAMSVPDGFNVDLVAAEPRVRQPIALAIDARGRLWVAEHFEYPEWSEEGNDRILIFDDKNGDGKYETRKVFYDELNFVSGLQVGFNGVWVGSAPDLLFIPDRNHDDKPDGPPEVRLTGWGHQDTHETLNGFIWGPDGWLYGCHGVFTHSKVGKPGTPKDERTPINAGFWRYHPTKREFEVFAWGTSNPWGIDFNDYGQAFSPVCVIPHLFHVVQGSRLRRQAGQHFNSHAYNDIKTIADHRHYAGSNIRKVSTSTKEAGGGHAHCGGMIYLGDNWPDKYRNTLFMSNIRGNRINNDRFVRKDSGFVGKHNPDFLEANDKWFRGINLKYGPDGGVYMIDWYDQEACHQQRPDDASNGRLYKITYGDVQPVDVNLRSRSDLELVELQLEKNDWYVRTARRILQRRAAEGDLDDGTRAALREMLRENPDPTRKLRAMWALHVTGGLTTEVALEMLKAENEYVRAWPIQLMAEDHQVSDRMLSAMARLSREDPSPVVRLYLASALQRLPHGDRWDIAKGLVQHKEDADDHNLPLMIWYGIEPLVPESPEKAIALTKETEISTVRQYIFRRAASNVGRLAPLIEELKSADTEQRQKEILDGMAQAFSERASVAMPEGWPSVFEKLKESSNPEIWDRARFIAVRFGDEQVFPMLRETLADSEAKLDRRQRALEILLSGKDPKVVPILHDLLEQSILRGAALRGLAQYDHSGTPDAILEHYSDYNAEQRRDAINTLSSRPDYALALLDAVEHERVPRSDLSAFTIRQLMKLANRKVESKVNQVWGRARSTPDAKKKRIAEYKTMLTSGDQPEGDPSRGRALFNQACAACHTLFGKGNDIGPDLTGSNRANLDYILLNVVDPNAVIGRDYQLTTIELKDGRIISGMVRGRNESSLKVQTLNEEIIVAREDIVEKEVSEASMMPEGLLRSMSDKDVRDLISYLASPSQVPLPGQKPIEGEELEVVDLTGGDAQNQAMGSFSGDDWSGDSHLWWTGAEPGDTLELALPVAKAGEYKLSAVMTKARDYGIVRLYLDGQPLKGEYDLYSSPDEGRSDVVTTGLISLGQLKLDQGRHRLKVKMVGANPDAVKRYMFGLDYLLLEPVDGASEVAATK